MTVACSDCGARQRLAPLEGADVARCRACGRLLDRAAEPALSVALAWSLALLVLLIAANLLPILAATLRGQRSSIHIASGVRELIAEGRLALALLVAMLVIVLPLVRASLLVAVLATLRTRRRPRWLGRAWRYAGSIQRWSIPEVLALAAGIVYMRVALRMSATVEAGGWCLLAAAALALLLPHVSAPQASWRALAPRLEEPAEGALACTACGLVQPDVRRGAPCARCARSVAAPRRESLARTGALALAAAALVPPAYLLPMSTLVGMDRRAGYTIFDALVELFGSGQWVLAAILFVASVCVPLGKLAGLFWLLTLLWRRRPGRAPFRTKLHRLIHRIGRWSHTDVLIVALSTALITFPGFTRIESEPGALAFALVVVFTMLASRSFDPRLIWTSPQEER